MEKRVFIIKLGTDILVNDKGIRDSNISSLIQTIVRLRKSNIQVIVVSSGAVRLGKVITKNIELEKPLAASIGQSILFHKYAEIAKSQEIFCASILLAQLSLSNKELFNVLKERIAKLLDQGVIPICNENDLIASGTSRTFGDNDTLAGLLSVALEASELIIVSKVGGLFTNDPQSDPNAERIPLIKNVSGKYIDLCSKSSSQHGTGGMISKLKAARVCSAVGIGVSIISETQISSIDIDSKNQNFGTYILPQIHTKKLKDRDRRILAARTSSGSVMIDNGASYAIKKGKNLLAVGIKNIYGSFHKGEVIEMVNTRKIGVAFGVASIDSRSLETKFRKGDIQKIRVAHANNIFIVEN